MYPESGCQNQNTTKCITISDIDTINGEELKCFWSTSFSSRTQVNTVRNFCIAAKPPIILTLILSKSSELDPAKRFADVFDKAVP
jgi:hypothetical protein